MNATDINPAFALASDLVNFTGKHVFLTGKAGTGKTTFLRYIREHTHKNCAVAAPTGVAAINAGGTTLHSLLQLPFGAFVPEGHAYAEQGTQDAVFDRHSLLRRLRISAKRRKLIEALELLIIDEISMVRADLLDMADTVLRHIRKKPHLPFGGLQLLYIGDMFQLPPVVRENDRPLLARYYKSPFFFDARVIQQAPPQYVELTTVYRQRDEVFVRVLNQVRNNHLDEEGLQLLRSRYKPGFRAPRGENFITLATHNYMADQKNEAELNALPGRLFTYDAQIDGDFPEHLYPIDITLKLRIGAQVMFIKNDLESPRRYFNGKIGVVCGLDTDSIEVQCPGEDYPISVPREVWQHIRYTYDNAQRTVKEDVLGKFTHFPLRLAWAITIHKSQGLTFDKAIIDAGQAFEAGQVYVALSRCTSLEGMVLLSPVHGGLVMTHERIAQFGRKERDPETLKNQTEQAKQAYFREQLSGLFDFADLTERFGRLRTRFEALANIFNSRSRDWMHTLFALLEDIRKSAKDMHAQLLPHLQTEGAIEACQPLHTFLKMAVPPFVQVLETDLWPHWRKMPGINPGESMLEAADYFEEASVISEKLKDKIQRMKSLNRGFDPAVFFSKAPLLSAATPQKQGAVQSARPAPHQQPDEIPHRELYRRLQQLTDAIVEREQVPRYRVAGAETLREICRLLPVKAEALALVKGFGERKIAWIGEEYMDLVQEYLDEMGLEPTLPDTLKEQYQRPVKIARTPMHKAEEKIPSADITFRLWQEGKTVAEIAAERGLKTGTIESHFSECILAGKVDPAQLLPQEKLNAILQALAHPAEPFLMKDVLDKLGPGFTYSEVRWVVAMQKRNAQEMV